ncbi:MAG: hypothetical protein RJB34_108 [Pseudomonadota bacterium]|jgi:hypothetical protein
MSNFVDIYQDLPCRVSVAWQRLQQQDQQQSGKRDLSVTAMLMAAATGLAMPFESLKDVGSGNRANWNDHPSFANGKQPHYKAVLKRCNDFLAQELSTIGYLKSIQFMHCKSMSDIRNAIEYGKQGDPLTTEQCTLRCLVRILRNALAHNNIVAFGNDRNQIKKLGFFAEKRIGFGCESTADGYHVVAMGTTELQVFLTNWFEVITPQSSRKNISNERPFGKRGMPVTAAHKHFNKVTK